MWPLPHHSILLYRIQLACQGLPNHIQTRKHRQSSRNRLSSHRMPRRLDITACGSTNPPYEASHLPAHQRQRYGGYTDILGGYMDHFDWSELLWHVPAARALAFRRFLWAIVTEQHGVT